ncbi:hypothetical protein Sjap_009027 [Stephania japonica]|uniref:Uncharacterized protein n=1 Tax=Stephania japonica TaxID=461633 RepID=A0AAP0JQN0_9MAGN
MIPTCSSDGKLLVSLGSGGPHRVWDVESSKVVASLSKENVKHVNNDVADIARDTTADEDTHDDR